MRYRSIGCNISDTHLGGSNAILERRAVTEDHPLNSQSHLDIVDSHNDLGSDPATHIRDGTLSMVLLHRGPSNPGDVQVLTDTIASGLMSLLPQ